MPLAPHETKAWGQKFTQEFNATPAPYYGVNTFDVNEENWEALLERIKIQHAAVINFGGHSPLWTVRDHGKRKRVCWINYYPTNIGEHVSEEVVASPEFKEFWDDFFGLLETYDWFCSSEVPGGTPL